MKNLKITAAVSAAMMMSSGAFALDPAATAAAPTQLVVAGASAARDAFASEFAALCQLPTLNVYRANPTTNQDFRAYSCQLQNVTSIPSSVRNTNVTVYYRSEGGSVYGPGSIAKGVQVKRLVVDTDCTTGTAGSVTSFGNCTVTDYVIGSDSGSGHLTNATTDLGVSDLEPAQFRGENWPSASVLGAEPAVGVLEGLNKFIGFGQSFGIAVNAPSVSINSISKADVASIFAGTFKNWSLVQDQATGNPATAQPIKVCRREKGSGTQAGSAIYFLQQQCGKSSEPFVTEQGPDANGYQVFTPDTTTALEKCINDNPGAIGPNVYKTLPVSGAANIKYLSIDGVAPGKVNAARGTYGFWFESAFTKRSGLTGNPDVVATLLINRSQRVAGIPSSSPSSFALAIPGVNEAVLPVNTADPSVPVGIGYRGGNTCKLPLGAL